MSDGCQHDASPYSLIAHLAQRLAASVSAPVHTHTHLMPTKAARVPLMMGPTEPVVGPEGAR